MKRWQLLLALLALPVCLRAAFPKPSGRVNDFARVLDAGTREEIAAIVRDVERQTGAEMAVVTVATLDGISIEEYANRLFREWGIGKARADNGVLILVAPAERRMRIEVGYGLEPILPDGLAGEIIRTTFLPRFRDNDYRGGMVEGVRRVALIVRTRYALTPDEQKALAPASGSSVSFRLLLFAIPFMSVFVAIGSFVVGVGVRTRTIFPLLWGACFGGIALTVSFAISVGIAPWILMTVAAAGGTWGYRSAGSPAWSALLRKRGRDEDDTSSDWIMGGGWSGGDSGGSSDSGGGFGGGDSGGGGASGSW